MVQCDICKILENKDQFSFIYEDEKCFAILHESPAVPGHTLVIPKQHAAIFEDVEDNNVEHVFVVCNKISTLLFERLQVHGTNIILNNGHDAGQELNHVVVNILPRTENDGLKLEWGPKATSENELKSLASRINSVAEMIFSGKDVVSETEIKKHEKKDIDKERKKEENYLAKAFRRTP